MHFVLSANRRVLELRGGQIIGSWKLLLRRLFRPTSSEVVQLTLHAFHQTLGEFGYAANQ